MTARERMHIEALSPQECETLLAKHHVARLAFVVEGQPEIEPINYVFADGWIYGRTSPGTKATGLQHQPWIALEIDEVSGITEWVSVVAHGTLYFLSSDAAGVEHNAYKEAVTALRKADPRVLADADPAPHRHLIFHVRPDRITGRRAR